MPHILAPRRLLFTLVVASLLGLLISPAYSVTPLPVILAREIGVGLVALVAFGTLERWPRTLPAWMARWALQVLGVALVIPLMGLVVYLIQFQGEMAPFWKDSRRLNGYGTLVTSGLLFAPWITVAVLFRQRDAAAKHQALAFELERSQLERNALDSRLRLLQAQAEPHFLFNTLANIRELVDSGAPTATAVLDNLIAYLRAAVPRLHESVTTMGQELQLVRAYLALMHMRMPDRLQYDLDVQESCHEVSCPPLTLLTLVENAVRHGIDPSEEGGRIDVHVREHDGMCHAQVMDTGVGLRHAEQDNVQSHSTGLAALRERLTLIFGQRAQLSVRDRQPRGVVAELSFPALHDTPSHE